MKETWNHQLIEEIRNQKEQQRSDDRDNLLRLTSYKLYGGKAHFTLELIQNAEDEGSKKVIFIIDEGYLAVINDGRPFDDEDVWGICSIRPGRKKNKIGFFGLGFKSVFNVSEKPQIISGSFNFSIENFIYPKPQNTIPDKLVSYYHKEKGAIFVLPITCGQSEILIKDLSHIDNKILLFLENINQLIFIDEIKGDRWEIRKEFDGEMIRLFDTRTEERTEWKVFHKTIKVVDENIVPEDKKGIKETRITIALPSVKGKIEELRRTGVIYCYLPTKQRADLGFLIQADFVPTIGRESISEEPWNEWLMKELGVFSADVFEKIKDYPLLGASLYELIPLSSEISENLIKFYFESLICVLKKKKIIKTEGGWEKAENCVMTGDRKLRTIFSEKDIKAVFNKKLQYVDLNIFEGEHKGRRIKLLEELGVNKIDEGTVISFLENSKSLDKKPKEWFLNLYDYLTDAFDVSKKWLWDDKKTELYNQLLKTNFIITSEEKVISLHEPEKQGRLICYPQRLNLKEIIKLFPKGEIIFIHPYFQESSIYRRKNVDQGLEEKRRKIKEWFDKIGVKKYFKEVHVIKDVIIPKFASGAYESYSESKLFEFIEYIKNHWNLVETEVRNKKLSESFIAEVKEGIRLKAYKYENGKKVYEYRKPSEIYFSKKYGKEETMEDLFDGIEEIYFLSEIYLKKNGNRKLKSKRLKRKSLQDWKGFLKEMGVWSSPIARIVQEKEITADLSFSWVKRERSTSYEKIYNDAESDDIKKLLGYCSRIDRESSKKRMIMLWEALQKNWKVYREKYCNAKYSWFYRNSQTKNLNDSSFLQLLKNADWIPASDGKFHKPSDLLLGSERNKLLAGDQRPYLELRADESFLKDLGIRIEPSIDEVISHLEEYRAENDKVNESDLEKTTKKMEAIYLFFKEKIEGIENEEGEELNKLLAKFSEKELIFIPWTEKQWWSPRKVFWIDFSDKFEDLRGFVQRGEHSAYIDEIKEFFFKIGIKMKPELPDCIETIEEIKTLTFDNKEVMKNILKQIYIYMNELMRSGLDEGMGNKEIFLTEKYEFKTPDKIYFCGDEELKDAFRDEIDFMIDIPEYKIRYILNKCCIKKFEDYVKIEKEITDEVEIEGGQLKDIISKLLYCEIYVERRFPEIFKEIGIDQISERLKRLQVKEAREIHVKYILTLLDKKNEIIKEIYTDCFYDKENGIIYKSTKIDIPSIEFVKEISKVFSGAEKEVFAFIDSMFSAKSEEDLEQKLSYFGIKIGDKPSERLKKEQIKQLVRQEKEGTIKIGVPVKDIKLEEGEGSETPRKQEEEKIESDLINPDDYEFHEKIIVEHVESHDTNEVSSKRINVKLKSEIERVESAPNSEKKIHLRTDAQSVALDLVMRYEKLLGRKPEDRHTQLRIGYDIYSKDDSGNERFIEVKHFRGDPGTWDLTSYEWEKAKQEKDKYFVYVVSGLKKGEEPLIQIIKNPADVLSPDPPLRKKFSNWKSAVGEEVKLKPINQKEEPNK